MSDIADRYRRRAAGLDSRVCAVPSDAWSRPSPCADWTARDVVRHVVDTSATFLGFIGAPAPDAPSVDDDPVAAWRAARDAIQARLDDPVIASTEYDGLLGRTTFEGSVDQFLSTDALIHTWDLARAAGLDERLDPDDVHIAHESTHQLAEQVGDLMRSGGAFGPEVESPAGADEQTQLLCFLGRRV